MVSALRQRVLEAKKLLGNSMKRELSENQSQTESSFGFKWNKIDTYSSQHVQDEWKRWLVEKYFDGKIGDINALLSQGNMKILDAGCGSGISAKLLFGEKLREHQYYGVDISNAVELCEKEFKKLGIMGKYSQCDLNNIDEDYGDFDIIFLRVFYIIQIASKLHCAIFLKGLKLAANFSSMYTLRKHQ